jgi:cell division protein FtsB
LHASIKAQQKQIDQLKSENTQLKDKLADLESRIALLEIK